MKPLLDIHLAVDYSGKPGVLRDVALTIDEGEILGLMGESGSGKSTLALALLRLLQDKGGKCRGHVLFRGRDLLQMAPDEVRRILGKEIALVPQSAVDSLNPALRVGAQLAEAWKVHERTRRGEWRKRTIELLERVKLPADEEFLGRFPKQLSVGQAQRLLIAMAVLHRPRLLVADEPTSALDAITRAEVLDLIKQLNRETNMAVLFVSHELLSIASVCRRLAILYQGAIVDAGLTDQILRNPAHPYTRALLRAHFGWSPKFEMRLA